jgi:hypothetical protein
MRTIVPLITLALLCGACDTSVRVQTEQESVQGYVPMKLIKGIPSRMDIIQHNQRDPRIAFEQLGLSEYYGQVPSKTIVPKLPTSDPNAIIRHFIFYLRPGFELHCEWKSSVGIVPTPYWKLAGSGWKGLETK